MKRHILFWLALLGAALLRAQETPEGVTVENLQVARNGEYMVVDMEVVLSGLEVSGDRAVLLTPVLKGDGQSLDLPSVGIYSRRRYFQYLRAGSMLGGADETVVRASQMPERLPYHAIVPYSRWMGDSRLELSRKDYACCSVVLDEYPGALLGEYKYVPAEPEGFRPQFVYVRPQAEAVKTRELSGRAFIDFPVSQTVIRPDYRANRVELDRIYTNIDSIRSDSDIAIKSLSIKGFASPEGTWDNNRRLAAGRTAALKEYVSRLYDFPEGLIATSSEPEDWEGLRAWVEKSALEHKREIVAWIDSDMNPDAKERKIKDAYPEEYRFLLEHCYPTLRRSDYRIKYEIRSFSDREEILRIMESRPQKLSLHEFYIASQGFEPGSDEFNEVFEIAVRMYPDDPTANLNAANTAMGKGDLKSAERYLSKAGEGPRVEYARGLHAALSGDDARAADCFRRALEGGVTEAGAALEQLEQLKKNE